MDFHTIELFAGVGMKRCPACGETKPETALVARSRGGFYSYCKPCHSEKSRPKTPEQVAARNARNVTYRSKIRADVLNAYGGKCECCGESHPEFLALDHISKQANSLGPLCPLLG